MTTFGATRCLGKAAVPTARTCYPGLCETSGKRAFAGHRGNRDFPAGAGVPASECPDVHLARYKSLP